MLRVIKFSLVLFVGLLFLVTIPFGSFAQTPQKGGTLSIVHTQFAHLNSAIQSGVATMVPGAQIFAGLVRLDDKFQAVPYLAKSWETSSDGLTWTFHLVNNATFHDGKPITSEDVAFSLETVKKNHPFGVAMFGNVDRVETPDPYSQACLQQPRTDSHASCKYQAGGFRAFQIQRLQAGGISHFRPI